MNQNGKRLVKIIVILSIIWFAIVVPVPLLWAYPGMRDSVEYQTYLVMTALVAILLTIRGIIWIIKPQLRTQH